MGMVPEPERVFFVVLWISVGISVGLFVLESVYSMFLRSRRKPFDESGLPKDDKRFDFLWTMIPVAVFFVLMVSPKFGAPRIVKTVHQKLVIP